MLEKIEQTYGKLEVASFKFKTKENHFRGGSWICSEEKMVFLVRRDLMMGESEKGGSIKMYFV